MVFASRILDTLEAPALSPPGFLKISGEVPLRCALLVLLTHWMIWLQPKTIQDSLWRLPWIGGKPFWGKHDGARWSSAWWCLPPKIWKQETGIGNPPRPSAANWCNWYSLVIVFLCEIGILSKNKSDWLTCVFCEVTGTSPSCILWCCGDLQWCC